MRIILLLLLLLRVVLAPSEARSAPAADDFVDPAKFDSRIKAEDREHWSFQPVKRPTPPRVKNPAWARNPIDAFVLAALEAKGWTPSPPAEPRVLLRRLHFDLVGLPPPVEHLDRDFDADELIDRLLDRPEYGERWARHWLDVVRFAESNGYERDAAKPSAWRYRDYVIDAFNKDKPYDRFLIEQLAGDELPDASDETRIAAGFLRLGPWDDEPADPAQDRFDQLDDMATTAAEVVLGLTLGCARCHDHKFEPITMLDYYRWIAVLNPLERPRNGRTELDYPLGAPEQIRRVAERDAEIEILRERSERLKVEPAPAEALGALADVDREIDRLRRERPDLTRGYVLREPSNNPPETRLLLRGQASSPGPKVPPGVPAVLVSRQPDFPPSGPHSSRRRLGLARWLADPRNPLTARVIVNRVWQHHFGEGLARTPNDFGAMGDPPTHPELLDFLADRFVSNGWSIKKLHRLILTSNTYRMSSRPNPTYLAEDPENRLLWRMNYRRLEVEAIRDAMLLVSGRLNPRKGGPSMFPFIPAEALEGSSDPNTTWKASDEFEASRRTIYAFVKRSMPVPMIEVLDFCDTARSAPKRSVTNVPTQALSLLNGRFVDRLSAAFAERLRSEAGDDPAKRIDLAYRLALSRKPSASELAKLSDFLNREAEGVRKESGVSPETAESLAWTRLARVVLNLNEFAYID